MTDLDDAYLPSLLFSRKTDFEILKEKNDYIKNIIKTCYPCYKKGYETNITFMTDDGDIGSGFICNNCKYIYDLNRCCDLEHYQEIITASNNNK